MSHQLIEIFDPDPVGSAMWDSLNARTTGELSSSAAPACRRLGMKGSDTTTYYGDPGPIQSFPISVGGAKLAFVAPPPQALPASTAPNAPTGLRALVAEFDL